MSNPARRLATLTRRQFAGLIGPVVLGGTAAGAAAMGMTDLALALLALVNLLALAALLRTHRKSAASAALYRRLDRRLARQERDLGELLERCEFADGRLLKLLEHERLRSEERHLECLRLLETTPVPSEAGSRAGGLTLSAHSAASEPGGHSIRGSV